MESHRHVPTGSAVLDVRLVGRYDIEQRQQRLEGFVESGFDGKTL